MDTEQTGAYLFGCGDPDAEQYLRQAIALDPQGSLIAQTALALTLLEKGKKSEALDVAERIVPSNVGVGPYYDMTMAMVYAANGMIPQSKEAWNNLMEKYATDDALDPEELLFNVMNNRTVAKRAIALLRKSRVISTVEPKTPPMVE
ncbi:tetratricopeptide repeat protein [Parasphingorhabdus halotolerans]|uniref:Tetratricopeptide repeat protein n=1 Tax=Parasphingorhabdus halotolerans TaxID=2725558 RepID=A0A6H2DQC2_9SPHN|nr:hypothetical protein [Parasphingorhabdus halotolerans]QJB70398.1 hypothetical protein HF685_14920 [Parasphingorhabdus halotolerans]